MTSKEAFAKYITHKPVQYIDEYQDVWNAACEWQKQQDLAAVEFVRLRTEETCDPDRPVFNVPLNIYIDACIEIQRLIKGDQS